MGKASDDFADGGGSVSNPTGKEQRVTASATLTLADHGGKTVDITMLTQDQHVILPDFTSATAAQRRIGFNVSKNSEVVKVYKNSNTGQRLVALLGPGASGHIDATAASADGALSYMGSGALMMPWNSNAPVELDSGGSMGTNSSAACQRAVWTSETCFVYVWSQGSTQDILGVVCTIDLATNVVTAGAVQTLRAVAANMDSPIIIVLSNGNICVAWYDSTNSKPEANIFTVNEGARTLSGGTAVDINAATTLDYNGRLQAMAADFATAGALWLMGPTSGDSVLTYCTSSGTTLSPQAANTTTTMAGSTTTELYSPAANKIVIAANGGGSLAGVAQYQWTGSAVTKQWAAVPPGSGSGITATTDRIACVLGNGKVLLTVANGVNGIFEVGIGSSTIDWAKPLGTGPYLDASGGSVTGTNIRAVNDRTIFSISGGAAFLLTLDRVYANSIALPVNRPPLIPLRYLGGTVHAWAIHPTTKKLATISTAQKAGAGNDFLRFSVHEFPRNF